MTNTTVISIHPIAGIPEVQTGDNIAEFIAERFELQSGDVVVIISKIVAKAEGQMVPFDREDCEARVALIEANAKKVLRRRGDLLITETSHGFVCAGAGIDFSNGAPGNALLLPSDPDRSAFKFRQKLLALTGATTGVVVSEAFDRAWRNGTTDIAVGCAGIKPILDAPGSTQICVVDEIASAAELAMGKSRRIPAVVIRGVDPDVFTDDNIGVSSEVIRSPETDLFR